VLGDAIGIQRRQTDNWCDEAASRYVVDGRVRRAGGMAAGLCRAGKSAPGETRAPVPAGATVKVGQRVGVLLYLRSISLALTYWPVVSIALLTEFSVAGAIES
jgi:hypothetical protein